MRSSGIYSTRVSDDNSFPWLPVDPGQLREYWSRKNRRARKSRVSTKAHTFRLSVGFAPRDSKIDSHKHVELTANTKNAAQAKNPDSGSRTVLRSADGDRYELRVDAIRTNAATHDASCRKAADVLLQPGQRVRLHAIQRDQGSDQVRAQCRWEECLLALREGK